MSFRRGIISRRKAAPNLSTGSISNTMVAWYDASDSTTIAKDGSNLVGQINDLSGNARHLVQATSGSKPTFIASGGSNNKSYISCVSGKSLSLAITQALPYTTYVVLKPISITNNASMLLFGSVNTNGINQNTNAGATLGSFGPVAQGTYIGTKLYNNAPTTRFLNWRFTFSTSATSAQVGNLQPKAGRQATSAGSVGMTKIQIGNNTSFYFHELIVYAGDVSDSDDALIRSYLATKYATVNDDYLVSFGDSLSDGLDKFPALACLASSRYPIMWGVSGTTLTDFASKVSSLYGKGVLNNGWVNVMYGTNNDYSADPVAWKATYKGLIQTIIAWGYSPAKIILCAPPVKTSGAYLDAVRVTVSEIATELGTKYVDFYTYTNGNASYTTTDGTHPPAAGQQLLGDYLATFLT